MGTYLPSEPSRNRTYDQQIKSLLLCRLSYGPALSVPIIDQFSCQAHRPSGNTSDLNDSILGFFGRDAEPSRTTSTKARIAYIHAQYP
jgi:hypothetical protein